jgi:hypothetical protein
MINVNFSPCKASVIIVRFKVNLNSKNSAILNLMKLHPVGADMFLLGGEAGRQTGGRT